MHTNKSREFFCKVDQKIVLVFLYEIQYELRFMNSISKSNIFVINLNSKDILRIFSSIKKYSTLAQPTYSNHRHLLFLFFKIVQKCGENMGENENS